MSNIQSFLNPTRGLADTAAHYLRANKEDNIGKQGGKLAAGLFLNYAIVVLGATETALTTTITGIAYPALWYFSPSTLDSLKSRVSIAFNATKDAFWGMFGYYPIKMEFNELSFKNKTVNLEDRIFEEEQQKIAKKEPEVVIGLHVIAKEEQKEIKKEEQVIAKEEQKEIKKEEIKKEPEVVIAKKEPAQEEIKKGLEIVVYKEKQPEVVIAKNVGRFGKVLAGVQNFLASHIGG